MMKNRGLIIFLIIILAILAFALTGGMFFLLSGKANFGFFNFRMSSVSSTLVYDMNYDNIFPYIKIDSDAGDIYIKHNDSNKVGVKIYGDTERLDVSDDTNLNVKYAAKKCIGFCFNIEKAKIEITIPKEYDGKMEIENKYGDTVIDEFLNASAEVKHHYGDITLEGIKNGEIVNKCGDINIGTIDVANVENNYGDVEIKQVLSSINVQADCGDIEVKNLTIKENSTIENSMGDIEIGTTNDIRIDAKTSLGDVDVRHNNYKSDIILTIDNSCGDITVKN